jgi:hypothetical protein
MNEHQNLLRAANQAAIAFYAATLNAPDTAEFRRLREVLKDLQEAVVHAENAARADVKPCEKPFPDWQEDFDEVDPLPSGF